MHGGVYHLSLSLASKDFLPLGVTLSVTFPSMSRSHPNPNPHQPRGEDADFTGFFLLHIPVVAFLYGPV